MLVTLVYSYILGFLTLLLIWLLFPQEPKIIEKTIYKTNLQSSLFVFDASLKNLLRIKELDEHMASIAKQIRTSRMGLSEKSKLVQNMTILENERQKVLSESIKILGG